ncbi:MAG: hypothetical protein IJ486_05250, partial [Firmicutes bacterium]|nr:hypothetical protein [Bacillota bacterium]
MSNNLNKVAQMIRSEIDQEILQTEKKYIGVPEDYHQEMLSFIHNLEREEATVVINVKKKRTKCWVRVASYLLVAFIGFNALAITASAAYRQRVFSLFKTDDGKGVTLRTEEETELLEGWSGYWYPKDVPREYRLVEANRKNKIDFLWFKSNKREDSIRIFVMPEEFESTYDIEFLTWDEMDVGVYDGYYMVDKRYNIHYGVFL